jgi:CheY-like chemotaxis protein
MDEAEDGAMPGLAVPDSVLIVEDDADIRETLEEILEGEGYAVAGAGDGAAALRYLRGTSLPRLILLDLMMPVMNGWEFRTEQLRDPSIKDIPTIVITGQGDAAQKAAALGAAEAIPKPIDVPRLLDAVRRYCG